MNQREKNRTRARTNGTTASMWQAQRSLKRAVCAAGMKVPTLIGFLCLILFGSSAYAQYSSGVEGTVMDSSGAVTTGAKIQLTNLDLGVSNMATSNDAGCFRIDSIAAGRYRLEITASSVKAWTETGVLLAVGQIRACTPKFEPAAANMTVTVSAVQAAVNLASARTDAVIGRQTVVQVPLVGQNVYELAALAPGVTGPGLPSGDNFNNRHGIQINAAGQRQESNSLDC